MKIKKKDSTAILQSLNGGVVPNRGLQYIIIGRNEEIKQIQSDLHEIKEDGFSNIKFFIGAFGTGKSFLQAFIKQAGFNDKFVVASADFSTDRRLYGNDGQAVALYSELMRNLSTKTFPEGNALPTILDQWIHDVQQKVAEEKGYDRIDIQNKSFVQEVEKEITSLISKMDELTGGYDFARVLSIYFQSYVEGDGEMKRLALRWIRGEYQTKTDALRDLGVREIINDNNYYGYIKVISKFVRQIGYAGMIVNLDEAINLYKITHTQAREKNYETILTIYNDILQGFVEGLYITFSGTPQFLEDERRGLYSYKALERRLKPGLEDDQYRDLKQPVIKLTPITPEETLVLLMTLRDIHGAHYKYEVNVSDKEIHAFLSQFYNRPGADKHIILGDVIRTFISLLNVLYENPGADRTELFGEAEEEEEEKEQEPVGAQSRFQKGRY